MIYEYAIIGAGASGLHLALAMLEDPFFANRQILIVDKDKKEKNDCTWCYWEQGEGKWDGINAKTWHTGSFIANGIHKELKLSPYLYKMVRGIDFYQHARQKLEHTHNFLWHKDHITDVVQTGNCPLKLVGESGTYLAHHVFDSRITPGFYQQDDRYRRLLQHFKGWIVETKANCFNSEQFVMMDFTLKWENQTSFTYLLPLSANKALIEFTFFTPDLVEEDVYSQMLKRYVKEQLSIDEYKIMETEKGIIPMSDYPFHQSNLSRLTKIGTAGSWCKPSTGYSFKNCERNANKIVQNIKSGRRPDRGMMPRRFRWYDSIFLEILIHKNKLGEEIFTSMYRKNDVTMIFKFLDEKTSIIEDLKIISSFRSGPFLRALFRYFKSFLLRK